MFVKINISYHSATFWVSYILKDLPIILLFLGDYTIYVQTTDVKTNF